MKLLYSFLKDMQLSLKSFYIYIELGFALVFVAVMLFAVPENFEPKVTVYAYLDLEGPNQVMAKESLTQEGYEVILLLSREEVEAELADNRSSVGLAVALEDGRRHQSNPASPKRCRDTRTSQSSQPSKATSKNCPTALTFSQFSWP